jgi:hypothetical protein
MFQADKPCVYNIGNVSLTIVIGQNFVAVWLSVVSTYLELKPEIASPIKSSSFALSFK